MSAADYIDLVAARQNWIGRMNILLAGFDAVLSPTVPMVAPPLAGLIDDDVNFFRVNGLLLRNTALLCVLLMAVTMPASSPDVGSIAGAIVLLLAWCGVNAVIAATQWPHDD
jgi:Asp-tRNA(Asn)/Glu-tRNA(Gln) amidotransferase A subunit family amidase